MVVLFESERRSVRQTVKTDKMNKLRAGNSEESDEATIERTLNLVSRLVERLEQQLDMTQAKGSLADYIKLLQLQKELEERRVRRIEVKWVDDD